MELAFPGKDAQEQHFLPKEYLETYFTFQPGKEEPPLVTFGLKAFHKAFVLGGVKGDTLIDIGNAPGIYQFFSACESFREIIATDFSDQDGEEMQRWLRKEPGAFDWSPLVKHVCELEGDRGKWAQKEEKVRRAVKQVLKCDVTQPNPLAPACLPPADCVLCSLFLEVICKDLASYCSALKNISNLVKPGGHLVLFAVLEDTCFLVGQQKFFCLSLDQKCVEEAVKGAGFDIVWQEGIKFSCISPLYNATGACVLLAMKR